MTEEEKLAKEYADKRIGKVLENSTFPNSYWHRQDWENCKQDFLAGLKVGKDMNVSIRWHDLRENPNDLPKEWQPVIAVTSYENYLILRFYPKTSIKEQHWRPLDDDILDNDNYFTEIIAWCELPKFEKE